MHEVIFPSVSPPALSILLTYELTMLGVASRSSCLRTADEPTLHDSTLLLFQLIYTFNLHGLKVMEKQFHSSCLPCNPFPVLLYLFGDGKINTEHSIHDTVVL